MGIVKQHPLTGAEMTLRFPRGATTEKLNKYSYEICRYHHERYDGSGYPDGLKGDEIPLCAQVVALWMLMMHWSVYAPIKKNKA